MVGIAGHAHAQSELDFPPRCENQINRGKDLRLLREKVDLGDVDPFCFVSGWRGLCQWRGGGAPPALRLEKEWARGRE
jgi:hypothetical protein